MNRLETRSLVNDVPDICSLYRPNFKQKKNVIRLQVDENCACKKSCLSDKLEDCSLQLAVHWVKLPKSGSFQTHSDISHLASTFLNLLRTHSLFTAVDRIYNENME